MFRRFFYKLADSLTPPVDRVSILAEVLSAKSISGKAIASRFTRGNVVIQRGDMRITSSRKNKIQLK
jgi:hypothetical protein